MSRRDRLREMNSGSSASSSPTPAGKIKRKQPTDGSVVGTRARERRFKEALEKYGPGEVRKLKNRVPVKLYNDEPLTTKQGQELALERTGDTNNGPSQPLSMFNAKLADRDLVPQRVRDTQAARSPRAKAVDRAFNAPLTNDPLVWLSDPARYDFPGVDTIQKTTLSERAQRRLEEGMEAGIVSEYRPRERLGVGTKGRASYRGGSAIISTTATVDDDRAAPRFQKGAVLAHELGHAVDYATNFEASEQLYDDPEARDELKRVSTLMRGSYEKAGSARMQYRELGKTGRKELFADLFASLAIQPRATKREAPRVTEILKRDSNAADFFEDLL